MGGDVTIKFQGGTKGPRVVQGDVVSGLLGVINETHKEVHDGDAFFINHVITLGDGVDYDIRIATPNTTEHAHMIIDVEAPGDTDVMLYEGSTVTDYVANRLTPINRNRNSSNESSLTICHTPGGSGTGTLIARAAFGVDTGLGANRQLSGGAYDGRHEIILKQNTVYLLRILSGTADNRMTVTLDWYELTSVY